MLAQLLPLLAFQAAPEIITTGGRIARPAPVEASAATATLAIRIEAAGEVLWDGTLRVAAGQGANYQQNSNQASSRLCPPESQHDRSERRQLTVNVYRQQNRDAGEATAST